MCVIYHNLTINCPKEKIFEAIATTSGMNNWWTLDCHGVFEINEVINLNFTDKYNWFAQISIFEVNQNIEFKVTQATKDWLPTRFGFQLIEENKNCTTVEFYHKNWKEISKEFRVASFCWAILLSQLKTYLENGTITPFEKRN
jgi:uncharacterized protein YndB with AHSA1/START domain